MRTHSLPHSRRVFRGLVAAGAAAALVLAIAGCGTGAAPGPKTEITVAVQTAPLSLDPAKSANTADNQLVLDLAYAPLISLGADGSLQPGLAESWEYTDENLTTFQLTLRPDAKFSDGTPVTAQSVVDSIQHVKNANGPVGIYANAVESAEATDELTVVLHLVQPNPEIGLLLTQRFLFGMVVGAAGVADPEMLGTQTVGAGPYVLDPEQTVSNDHYTFVPNEHYWDQDAIHFESFTVRVIANPQTALNALQSGQVSYIGGSFAGAPQAEAAGLTVHSTPSAWYSIFLLDRNGELVPALKDQRVRQALNYAIDREAITTALFGEYGEPNSQPSIPGYEEDGFVPDYVDYYDYDPAKAEALLEEAGFGDGFTLTIGASPVFGNGIQMAQAVASDWEKIGVTAEIESFATIGDIVGPWGNKELPLTAGYYDCQPMFIFIQQSVAKDAGLFNPFQSQDDELDGLIAEAYATTDEAAVPEAWAAVQRRLVELGWFIPIATGSALYFSSSDLQGVDLSPVAFVPDPTRFHF
jgi:peptide/nickel transport system substrate-binding protein